MEWLGVWIALQAQAAWWCLKSCTSHQPFLLPASISHHSSCSGSGGGGGDGCNGSCIVVVGQLGSLFPGSLFRSSLLARVVHLYEKCWVGGRVGRAEGGGWEKWEVGEINGKK